jgi:phage anti-repressor protein
MEYTIDFVSLIEKNPITKLSSTYQNTLLDNIKSKFLDKEQQLFVASFYCYLNYNPRTDFLIDLDNIWPWLGFTKKVNIKRLIDRYFEEGIDYIYSSDTETHKRGGSNIKKIMLNLNTFKLLCIKADTKKANEIHTYFIKLEEILHETISQECNDFKQLLQKSHEELDKNKQEFDKRVQLEKHNFLLKAFASSMPIVYIIRVKQYETGEYIVKIGESRRGIERRFLDHKSNYEEAIILNCYSVKRSKDFEAFIHNHPKIKPSKVKNLSGHENENELFLIGKELSYKILLDIIDTNVMQYNDISYTDYENLKKENEILKLENDNYASILKNGIQPIITQHQDNSILNEILRTNKLLIEKVEVLENKINNNMVQCKTTTNFGTPLATVGPRLQQINPETMQLVRVYESVSECMKTHRDIKRPSIAKAVAENTVYSGYRWSYIDRELNPNDLSNIKPTRQTQPQKTGYVAKLNQTKSEIVQVYLDRKTAALENGKSISCLDNPMKNGTIVNGFYYVLYNSCPNELRAKFNDGKEPLLYKSGVGQYNINNQLIREFSCKYDCIKKLNISDKTLMKALDKNVLYNDTYFRSLGEKLVCGSNT